VPHGFRGHLSGFVTANVKKIEMANVKKIEMEVVCPWLLVCSYISFIFVSHIYATKFALLQMVN
jgi:hypothetical protein